MFLGFFLGLYVYIPSPFLKKYVNTVDVVYSFQIHYPKHNMKLRSIANGPCPCTGICISINCIIRRKRWARVWIRMGLNGYFPDGKIIWRQFKNIYNSYMIQPSYLSHMQFKAINVHVHAIKTTNVCRKIRLNKLRRKNLRLIFKIVFSENYRNIFINIKSEE